MYMQKVLKREYVTQNERVNPDMIRNDKNRDQTQRIPFIPTITSGSQASYGYGEQKGLLLWINNVILQEKKVHKFR